jgi:hypothetical protein
MKPGDALEVMSTGDVIVLHLLKPVLRGIPPVSPKPVSWDLLAGVDLDEPEFDSLSNESVARYRRLVSPIPRSSNEPTLEGFS